MKKVLTIAAITTLLLTGCGNEIKSIDYYKAHIDEAKAVKDVCEKRANDGSMEVNQLNPSDELKNCMNATHAIFVVGGKKPIKGNEPNIKTW